MTPHSQEVPLNCSSWANTKPVSLPVIPLPAPLWAVAPRPGLWQDLAGNPHPLSPQTGSRMGCQQPALHQGPSPPRWAASGSGLASVHTAVAEAWWHLCGQHAWAPGWG